MPATSYSKIVSLNAKGSDTRMAKGQTSTVERMTISFAADIQHNVHRYLTKDIGTIEMLRQVDMAVNLIKALVTDEVRMAFMKASTVMYKTALVISGYDVVETYVEGPGAADINEK